MYYFDNGIKQLEQKSFIKRLFCKHTFKHYTTCSSMGLTRISGEDKAAICIHCGKVKDRYSIEYV